MTREILSDIIGGQIIVRGGSGLDSARKLRRIDSYGWIGGICAGVSYWLGCPVWVVRLVWFLATWFQGVGLGLYILLWILLPKWEAAPEDFKEVTGD